jgi:hypothetical protein
MFFTVNRFEVVAGNRDPAVSVTAFSSAPERAKINLS